MVILDFSFVVVKTMSNGHKSGIHVDAKNAQSKSFRIWDAYLTGAKQRHRNLFARMTLHSTVSRKKKFFSAKYRKFI